MNIKKILYNCSYQGRRKRELTNFIKTHNFLESMGEHELSCMYVSLKSKYEYRKNVQTAMLVVMAMAFLSNVWKLFYNFLNMTLLYVTENKEYLVDTKIIMKSSFIITAIVTSVLTVTTIITMTIYFKNTNNIFYKLKVIEEIRGEL